MFHRKPLLMLCCLSLFFAAACKTTNFVDTPATKFTTLSGRASLDDVRKAIILAGTTRMWPDKWAFSSVGPGHLIATLKTRGHVVVLNIKYTESSYKITYKDSKEMLYDGKHIHRKYYTWVRNLENHIDEQLAKI